MMNVKIKIISAFLCIAMALMPFSVKAADSIEVYTPYTRVSVTPGSTVNYSIDVINNGSSTSNSPIIVSGLSRSWDYTLTASGLNVSKIAVLKKSKKTVSLKVDVPYNVRKGYYNFSVKVGNGTLPLTINVSSAGSNESVLTCDQTNMEGNAETKFYFSTVLKNKTPRSQQYALMSNPPKGWRVEIKVNSKQVTSTEVDAGGTKNIRYTVTAPNSVAAGTYKIPVKAVSGNSQADLEFEVVVTGSYKMNFSTYNELLSTKTTAGRSKKIELKVKNTGTLPLKDIQFSSSKPKNWEVDYDTKKVESLNPGATATVYATIKVDKKAIPGDYMCKLTAKTDNVNEALNMRVSVRTSILAGWLGFLIIIIAIGGVVFLIRKYGRR